MWISHDLTDGLIRSHMACRPPRTAESSLSDEYHIAGGGGGRSLVDPVHREAGVDGIAIDHVALSTEQTKLQPGAARLSTLPPRFYVEGVGAMGRGRQKAKQTKVARALKYYSPDTNYKALEQELTGHGHTDVATQSRRPDVATESRYSDASDDDRYEGYTGWSDDR
jgi:hypothetical protein